jgi:glutathione S-transferase
MSIEIAKDYAYVLVAATAISLQVIIIGFGVGGARKKHGVKYPDMGNGRYSAKLNDADWEDFNNHMRAHYNYVEGVASITTALLISGLFYPRWSAAWGATYVVGRQLYAIGYRRSGAQGRLLGVGLVDVGLFTLIGTAFYGAINTILAA